MNTAISFVRAGIVDLTGLGLGRSTAYVAVKGSAILCLVGSENAYRPKGGRKTLRKIVESTVEGKTYYWKPFRGETN